MSWTATPQEIALLDRTIERVAPYFEKPDIGQDNVARVRDVLNSISGGAVGATMENTDLRRTYMFCKLLRYLCAQPPPVPQPELPSIFRGSLFSTGGGSGYFISIFFDDVYWPQPADVDHYVLERKNSGDTVWTVDQIWSAPPAFPATDPNNGKFWYLDLILAGYKDLFRAYSVNASGVRTSAYHQDMWTL
jgi:hypothetical protein